MASYPRGSYKQGHGVWMDKNYEETVKYLNREVDVRVSFF